MVNVTFQSKNVGIKLDVNASQAFITCLMAAAVAAVPAFLEGLMKCLATGGPSTGYDPGDRDRCQVPG